MKLVSFAVAHKFQLKVSTCNGGFRVRSKKEVSKLFIISPKSTDRVRTGIFKLSGPYSEIRHAKLTNRNAPTRQLFPYNIVYRSITLGNCHYDYNYQNPSVFCFLILIIAIVLCSLLGLQNLNLKRETK